MKILYASNAFWASSGYGVQGKSLLPRLAELPQVGGRSNVAMFAWYGLQGGIHNVDGFRVYPAGADAYGNDIIGSHTKNFKADIVISLIDVWVMKNTAQSIAPALWLPWLPIDHDPVPEKVLAALDGAYIPLTYSKWGHDLLAAAGVDNVYIPHGIEPDIYKILPESTVAGFRREIFGDPGHLAVMVAANKGFPDRKAFQVQLRSWAAFAADKPDARLYLHTEQTTMQGGLDLAALVANLGITDKVIFPDRYTYFNGYPAEYLALAYNAADVFLGAAMSEGFGIPIIEAQACGTPVIVTGATSMPELVRWGQIVAPADRFWTPLNAWQAWPSVTGIEDALHELYAQWRDNGRQWETKQRHDTSGAIHAEFGWDVVARSYWAPLMARLADVLQPAEMVAEYA